MVRTPRPMSQGMHSLSGPPSWARTRDFSLPRHPKPGQKQDQLAEGWRSPHPAQADSLSLPFGQRDPNRYQPLPRHPPQLSADPGTWCLKLRGGCGGHRLRCLRHARGCRRLRIPHGLGRLLPRGLWCSLPSRALAGRWGAQVYGRPAGSAPCDGDRPPWSCRAASTPGRGHHPHPRLPPLHTTHVPVAAPATLTP